MPRLRIIAGLALAAATAAWAGENADKASQTAPAPRAGGPAGSIPRNVGEAPTGPRLNNPLSEAQRFLQMTPEEQERLMERANPQQQERMRAARERYNRLPLPARVRLLRQYQLLRDLPVEKQVLISRQFQSFNKLPDDRRWPVAQELVRLHRMPAEEREARLGSEDFTSRYSAPEQEILRGLALNLPREYPLAGRPGN